MRMAIFSDVHGNLTALEAVAAALRDDRPDLVLHGGDLADGGSSGCEVVDLVRAFGCAGVAGNTDEMLFRPESLAEFARGKDVLQPIWSALEEVAAFTRDKLGSGRLAWLANLPPSVVTADVLLVHASPTNSWRAPAEAELESVFPGPQPVSVYGHVHVGSVRQVGERYIANSGSVGLPYDGDPRASYLIIDDGVPELRRVEYDMEQEIARLKQSGVPHAEWTAAMLRAARPVSFQ